MNKITQDERTKLTAYARRLMERDGATPAQAEEALRARTGISHGRALGCAVRAMRQMRKEARRQASGYCSKIGSTASRAMPLGAKENNMSTIRFVPAVNWTVSLAQFIRESKDGDEIVCRAEAQRSMARSAIKRMCPNKEIKLTVITDEQWNKPPAMSDYIAAGS